MCLSFGGHHWVDGAPSSQNTCVSHELWMWYLVRETQSCHPSVEVVPRNVQYHVEGCCLDVIKMSGKLSVCTSNPSDGAPCQLPGLLITHYVTLQ